MRNKLGNKTLLVVGFAMILSSCMAPATKESYLKDFESFVERVEKHHKDYNKKDWEWADSKFEKYSNEWYRKIENELNADEKLHVIEMKMRYIGLKGSNIAKEFYRKYLKDDLEKGKKKVDEYIEKDLDEDIDQVIKGAKEIGDSAIKVLEDVIEKLDNTF